MSEKLICDGHILYGLETPRQYDHGTEFPVAQLRAEAEAKGAQALATFERTLAELLEIGSLKRPEQMKSARDLAALLSEKDAEAERLRAELDALKAAGIAPSLLQAGVVVSTAEGTPAKPAKKAAE